MEVGKILKSQKNWFYQKSLKLKEYFQHRQGQGGGGFCGLGLKLTKSNFISRILNFSFENLGSFINFGFLIPNFYPFRNFEFALNFLVWGMGFLVGLKAKIAERCWKWRKQKIVKSFAKTPWRFHEISQNSF